MIELDPPNFCSHRLIDLGILGNVLTPVTSQELVARGKALAERFRAAKATVVLVNVAFSPGGADVLRQPVDQASPIPAGGLPAGWNEFPPGLMQSGDLQITKRQWGAFYGTELDLQRTSTRYPHNRTGRRCDSDWRGIDGASELRAWLRVVIVKDATTSNVAEPHEMSMKHIMPRLGRIVQSTDIALTHS